MLNLCIIINYDLYNLLSVRPVTEFRGHSSLSLDEVEQSRTIYLFHLLKFIHIMVCIEQ